MSSKNTIKIYAPDAYYHVYNRGVEKRTIFIDDQDYRVFLTYLKEALLPPPKPEERRINVTFKGSTFKGIPRLPKNFNTNIKLIAFVLMPNHFHLLVHQKNERDIKSFVHSLLTRYSVYFNKRYERVGRLFQGIYKATLVDSEGYLLHLSRYIHRNPLELEKTLTEAYSSYAAYLGKQKIDWLKPNIVLSYFSQKSLPVLKKVNSYQAFVEELQIDEANTLGNLTLDNL